MDSNKVENTLYTQCTVCTVRVQYGYDMVKNLHFHEICQNVSIFRKNWEFLKISKKKLNNSWKKIKTQDKNPRFWQN